MGVDIKYVAILPNGCFCAVDSVDDIKVVKVKAADFDKALADQTDAQIAERLFKTEGINHLDEGFYT